MYKISTLPASEPLLLAEAKEHLRIKHTDQDDLITNLITAAREQMESDVPELKLIQQTWILYMDEWPSFNDIRSAHVLIDKYPLISVDSIQYISDGETELTEWASTNYKTDLISFPGRIEFLEDPPDINSDVYNAVQITFKCGWNSADYVPEDIKQGLQLLIAHFYDNPAQVVSGTSINQTPFGYQQIVQNYTKNWLA